MQYEMATNIDFWSVLWNLLSVIVVWFCDIAVVIAYYSVLFLGPTILLAVALTYGPKWRNAAKWPERS